MTEPQVTSRRIVLTSRLPFREPRKRYDSGSGWISRAQVHGESQEHLDASLAWLAAVQEEARLFNLLPEGYEWTGRDPFAVENGEIIVSIHARMDTGDEA